MRLFWLCLTGLAATWLGAAPPALAQERPVELRFSHWVPVAHPMHAAAVAWGESIGKASNGTITIKIFPAQQLGKAFDHYDMARDGIADLTYINPGYQPGRFPLIGVGELPFLISSAEGGSRALDEWYRKYAEKEMKDVKFCLAFVHSPSSFHSRTKKIVVPEDLKGMKIRPAHATMASYVTSLGGTNVQSSAPEVRDLLEKGVADAVSFPWGSVILFGIDKVVKYHMEAPLYVTTFAFVMNKDKYNQMSERQKKAVDAHCNNEQAGKVAAPWGQFEDSGVDKIKAQGDHEVYKLTPEQTTAWKKAAEPLYRKWSQDAAKTGIDAEAAMKDLKAALARHKASTE